MQQRTTFSITLFRSTTLALILASGFASAGCNMFASLGNQARGTMNTLTKRNVDFDRPA